MEQYANYNPMQPRKESDLRRFIRQRKQVPVNTAIILINIAIFLTVEFTGSSLNTQHMVNWGAAYTPWILQEHEYYRLLTCMFLHFGIRHLGNNMLVLFFVGDCLERSIGKIKYLLIYLLGEIGANIFSLGMEVYRQ